MNNIAGDTSAKQTKTALLIANHRLYREALACLLQKDQQFEAIAEADLSIEAIDIAKKIKPKLILLDLETYSEDSVSFIRQLRVSGVESRILLLSESGNHNASFNVMRDGVSGIVLKKQSSQILFQAIGELLSDGSWFDHMLLTSALQEAQKPNEISHKNKHSFSLSKREKEIVCLIVNGNNTSAIASMLGISKKTVRNHIFSIYGKLEVNGRLELALFAARNGICPHGRCPNVTGQQLCNSTAASLRDLS